MSPRLTPAQAKALREIQQPGGHGIGPYSYLPEKTAEALARLGLVVLGWHYLPSDRRGRMKWAIAAGTEPPIYFKSRAQESAEWDAYMADLKARTEARVQAVLAHAQGRVRPGEMPGAHAERVARIEQEIRRDARMLEAAEKLIREAPSQKNPRPLRAGDNKRGWPYAVQREQAEYRLARARGKRAALGGIPDLDKVRGIMLESVRDPRMVWVIAKSVRGDDEWRGVRYPWQVSSFIRDKQGQLQPWGHENAKTLREAVEQVLRDAGGEVWRTELANPRRRPRRRR